MNEDVQRYIDTVQDERRSLFDTLQALVLRLYPDAEVVLSYQIPTYKFARGWVALGYWKQSVSPYTNGPHNIAELKAQHPAIKTGKGSTNSKAKDVVPVAALEKVIRRAVEQPK